VRFEMQTKTLFIKLRVILGSVPPQCMKTAPMDAFLRKLTAILSFRWSCWRLHVFYVRV